jgi:hypothetical protein
MRIDYHVFERSVEDLERCSVCGNKESAATGTGHVETETQAHRLNRHQLVGSKILAKDLERYDRYSSYKPGIDRTQTFEVTGPPIVTSQSVIVPVRNAGEDWLRHDELVTLVGRV